MDVVQANIKAALNVGVSGAFNLGCGNRITINKLVEMLTTISGIQPKVTYGPPRAGDVRDSLADISAAHQAFGFHPQVNFEEELKKYIEWAEKEFALETQNKG